MNFKYAIRLSHYQQNTLSQLLSFTAGLRWEWTVNAACPPGEKWGAKERSALRLWSTKVVFPSHRDMGKYPPGRLAGAMHLEIFGQH